MYGDAYPLGPETDLWRLFAKNLPTRTYEKDQMIYWQEGTALSKASARTRIWQFICWS
mgnify:CR=1 FL=1